MFRHLLGLHERQIEPSNATAEPFDFGRRRQRPNALFSDFNETTGHTCVQEAELMSQLMNLPFVYTLLAVRSSLRRVIDSSP